ncbi:hypothetical protein [Roseobacter sp. HKCCA0434]|uniref:hypothetical protein n=1 Tax=Roseobacter sp. HKCCA0434 TaxID=3079297 RepID=UPI0029059F7E|nr:hypothetical protein [Roseobacter sp. HKCCA0434]
MRIMLPTASTALLLLTACGGGGGGGGGVDFGAQPSEGQSLAQVAANEPGSFSTAGDAGGIGRSVRYRDFDPTPGANPPLIRNNDVTTDRLNGIEFTADSGSATRDIFVRVGGDRSESAVQLVSGVDRDVRIVDDAGAKVGTVTLRGLDLTSYDNVIAGTWFYDPNAIRIDSYGGFHGGSLAPASALTGTATFDGAVQGRYLRKDDDSLPLDIRDVTGEVSITFDFDSDRIVEPASAMFNLQFTDGSGDGLNTLQILNDPNQAATAQSGGLAAGVQGNSFYAQLQPAPGSQANDGTDFSTIAEGDLVGRFYGPAGDVELGGAFRMRERGARELFVGAIVAQ